MSVVHWICEYDSNSKNPFALLYMLPHILLLAIFPKRSTYCTVSRTKSLNSRSLPVSVVINPEECFVWLNKQLWSGIGPLALLQSQFSVISCRSHCASSNGKMSGRKPNSYSGPTANLGPITEWVYIKAAGLTDREHGLEKPWVFQQTTVMLGSHLHLHKL